MKIYAVYKGDEFLFMGTLTECAEHFKVKRKTISYWTSAVNRRRILQNKKEKSRINSKRKIAIVVEEEEE